MNDATKIIVEPSKVEYDDRAVKQMIYPSIIFLVLGMFVGVFISFNAFVFPDYFSGEYISFGRVRPVHVLHVTLLWLLSANMGLVYYFVPRLCGVSLWSPRLATVTSWIWWVTLIIGTYSMPFGTNYGWEYAELPMLLFKFIPIKVLVVVAWLLFMINIFMTISKRKYEKMYVSLWYTMATLVWTAFTFTVGNLALETVPGGISRVNMSFFYVHNLVGLIFTPLGLAIAYYFIPRTSNTPLYSHKLSMIGFWSIAFFYSWIGAHHIMHGPMSQWLQTTSIIFSVWLFIPVWTVITNFFATMKQDWKKYTQSVPVRFLMVGTLYYLFTCMQGPLMALRNVNEITSKTDWVIGHAHMSLYGTFTFFALAGVYYVIPVIVKKPLWSKALADWHFSLNFLGSMMMFVALCTGGYLQGLSWASWSNGNSYAEFLHNYSQLPFLQTVADLHPWWIARGISGLIILAGNILFLWNMLNTIILKPVPEESSTDNKILPDARVGA
jgi:cytochrome c oxidase cbb3-type subunit 1